MRRILMAIGEVMAITTLAALAVLVVAFVLVGNPFRDATSAEAPSLVRCPLTGEMIWAEDCPLRTPEAP